MQASNFLIAAALSALVLSPLASAEGLADRRNELGQSINAQATLDHIHAQHGVAHSGPNQTMPHHESESMNEVHLQPKYLNARSDHRYHGLTAQQYRRVQFGSNN